MTEQTVEAFLSIQSPYCYFAMPRLRRLAAVPGVSVKFRPVLPAVIRIPDAYAHRSALEQSYFLTDVARTAEFLGMDYAEADPYPVRFVPGSLWRAEEEQPRVWRLYRLLFAAEAEGRGLVLYDRLMHLIWSGTAPGWDAGTHIAQAISAAGLDPIALEAAAEAKSADLPAVLAANNDALAAAGHWGVPCCALAGEPFYGQDRLDQLAWRLGLSRELFSEVQS